MVNAIISVWLEPMTKRVKPRSFREGDLVLKKILQFKEDVEESPNPSLRVLTLYLKSLSRGALDQSKINGDLLLELASSDFVKKHFV